VSLDPIAETAIDTLTLSGRPLLVVDVDEVVLHMVKPLTAWLALQGLQLDIRSYRLGGNIRRVETGEIVPDTAVAALIQAFFDDRIHAQEAVADAADVLGRLERRCDVILLTNAPHRHRETRLSNLAAQRITAPLITSSGPKGPAVQRLRDRSIGASSDGTVVFIDDSTQNLESVHAFVPEATLVHFIAHPDFRALARDVAGVSLKTGDWLAVERLVAGLIGQR